MVFGFNTDVPVGKAVFHVQTEDRGPNNPIIDTTIYVGGRVLARRTRSYREFLSSPDFSESELQAILERQHHELIEEIRCGQLPEMTDFRSEEAAGISVRLLNASRFMVGTTAVLRVGVTDRKTKQPVAATIRAQIQIGSGQPVQLEGSTGTGGEAEIQLPLPRLGPGGAELLIQAVAGEQCDEIRYHVRRKG